MNTFLQGRNRHNGEEKAPNKPKARVRALAAAFRYVWWDVPAV